MVSSGMIECASEHEELAQDLVGRRAAICDAIALALARWLDDPTANSLARYFAAVLQGISVQARDGASRAQLEGIAEEVIAGFRAKGLGGLKPAGIRKVGQQPE